ncbi:putative Rossmann-fold nucleotide-binding protein [Bradyrhizobium diazoefficiens]
MWMPGRRAIVGVIGGDGQMEPSVALGRVIAQRGWILLTGGQVLPRATVECKGEVKDGSMLGAAEVAPATCRLIGILPSSATHWDYAEGGRRLFLHTGQPHYIRNVINGRTPDVVVAFGGSRGTLAEIAFATACGRPVLFSDGGLERLRQRFRDHFGQRRQVNEDMRKYFERPLEAYPEAAGEADDAYGLVAMLNQKLSCANEVDDIAAAVSAVIGRLWRDDETGFPGLPKDRASKPRFEAIVQAISQ